MPGSPQVLSTEPVLASTLLNLELQSTSSGVQKLGPQPTGLRVEGLDLRFNQLWSGGSVVGIGAADPDDYEVRTMVPCTLKAAMDGHQAAKF